MDGDLQRFAPSIDGQIAYEHLHRYALAKDFVADASVLDVACGEGYGAWTLSRSARQVVGVDLDPLAIQEAVSRYQELPKVSFRTGDCLNLPFEPLSFDVVVSFETVEHVFDAARFVREAKRVLKRGGLLIISTPDREIYNRNKQPNPYHTREFTAAEFRELLEAQFRNVELSGQRMAIVSTIAPLKATAGGNVPTWRGYSLAPGVVPIDPGPGVVELAEPEYLIAFCSDVDPPQPIEPHSVFLRADDDLWRNRESVIAWASRMHDGREAVKADLDRLIAERDAIAAQTQAALARAAEPSREITTAALSQILGRPVASEPSAHAAAMAELLAFDAAGKAEVARLRSESNRVASTLRHLAGVSGKQVADADIAVIEIARALERAERLERDFRNAQIQAEDAGKLLALREAELTRRVTEADEAQDRVARFAQALERDLRNAQIRAEEADKLRAEREVELTQRVAEADEARAEVSRHAQAIEQALGAAKSELADQIRRADDLALALEEATSQAQALKAKADAEAHRRAALEHGLSSAQDAVIAAGRERDDLVRRLAASDRALEPLKAELARAEHLRGALDRVARTAARLVRQQQEISAEQGREVEIARSAQGRLAEEIGIGVLAASPRLSRSSYPFQVGRLVSLGDAENRKRNWAKAELYYAAALRKTPSLSAIWIQYGHALKEQGKAPLAEIAYRQAALRAPANADAPFQLARVLVLMGRYIEARAAYQQALRLDPSNADARGELERLPAPPNPALAGEAFEPALREALSAEPTLVDALDAAIVSGNAGEWPPRPVDGYWLPQGMRDYLFDRWGESQIPLYQYLMSIVDRLSVDPARFADGDHQKTLRERIRRLAAEQLSDRPIMSIVIPVFNNLALTLTCVLSILENASQTRIEILVGDDASTDSTAEVFGAIGGCIRLIRHESNRGFLHNCNRTCALARGDVVVLLNNDTLVLPGWLDTLREALDRDPTIGLVGSKLLNGDGTLQEAGGILWRDGTAWNFGRGGDPRAPEFNYLKDVDYISGASIALRTETWRTLGGFDPDYSPAYCEDSDLAFRIRQRGLRVVYAPGSEIIHHEGRSHGTDVGSGLKAYQLKNSAKFVERWRSVLAADHFENGANVLVARDRSRHKPHILVIDHYVPEYDRDAGSRTMMSFLRIFSECGFQVIFWPDNLNRTPKYTEALQNIGVEVIYGLKFTNKFDEWLSSRAETIDYVLVSRPHIASRYLSSLEKFRQIKRIYYGHDLHFKRLEQQLEVTQDLNLRSEIIRVRDEELDICRRSAVALYPSQIEVEELRPLLQAQNDVRSIPAYVFDDGTLTTASHRVARITHPKCPRLLFVGGFAHRPNVDALVWFVKSVVPQVAVAGVRPIVEVVGSGAPREVAELAGDHIHILGRVSDEDLGGLYDQASVVVAPLRFGGGIKGKVVEAMAQGVPIVMTNVGAQGIPEADKLGFVADGSEDFAAAVVYALTDRDEAARRAARALEFVRTTYTSASVRRVLQAFMPELTPMKDAASSARLPL